MGPRPSPSSDRLRGHCDQPFSIWWHRLEPFLTGQLFHIVVQGLWGNDPATVLIELWKLPLRSAQPTQRPSLSFCCLHTHRDKKYPRRCPREPAPNRSSAKVALRNVLDVHGL